MGENTIVQLTVPTTRRAPKLFFRPANARRPFRRGDLAMHHGTIVVVCMSEQGESKLDAELPVLSTRGVEGSARPSNRQLLAGADAQEFGTGYGDLLKFIASAGAVTTR